MQKISVSKKTGFFTYGSPVVIYDHRSKPFYMHPANGGKFFSFNLPKGEYFTECECEPMREPIPYALPTLPKRQKNIPIPARLKQMRVKIGRNPNKASVIVGVHSVLVDPAIFALPLPNIIFVLFHEIGHYYCSAANVTIRIQPDTMQHRNNRDTFRTRRRSKKLFSSKTF